MQFCEISSYFIKHWYYLAVQDGELLEKGDVIVATGDVYAGNCGYVYLIPRGARNGKHLCVNPRREFVTPLHLSVDQVRFLEHKESIRLIKPDWALRRAGYKRMIDVDIYPEEKKVWHPVNALGTVIHYSKIEKLEFVCFTRNGTSVWTNKEHAVVRLSNELIFGYYLTYREVKRKRAKIFRALNADAP